MNRVNSVKRFLRKRFRSFGKLSVSLPMGRSENSASHSPWVVRQVVFKLSKTHIFQVFRQE
ncbi:hypothetical protein MAL08_15660 [Leptospira noguchii]|uniref:hypothetical protein n=1 Tax=Leptospira noguchii TaxID=28182 RepID=UPI001FB6F86C|nr:hypothetical protein [Leptospira noguchii]UOG37462.1 hypothetical protein MAL08_15660 [Leptospira noguchii]